MIEEIEQGDVYQYLGEVESMAIKEVFPIKKMIQGHGLVLPLWPK